MIPQHLIICLAAILLLLPKASAENTTCSNGNYLSFGTLTCLPCPIVCATCSQPQLSSIVCLSCPLNSNRNINSNDSKYCVCKQNYIQTLPIQSYCCHKYCLTCNQSSCTSCPLFTNRMVDDESGLCVCKDKFIETQNEIVCGCGTNSYFYLNKCFPCPLNCGTCQYKQSTIICTSCYRNMNRNSSTPDCACNTNFTETTPYISFYCYAINCAYQDDICYECKGDTIISDDGICICKIGYFVNTSNICEQCTTPGCLDCKGQAICVNCNEEEDYFLIQDVCAQINIYDYIITYDEDGHLVMQFDYGEEILPSTYNLVVEIDKILPAYPDVIPSPLPIQIISHDLSSNNVITIRFNWTDQRANITDFIMFLFEFDYLQDPSLPFDITSVSKNIKVDRIYPPSLMSNINEAPVEYALCIVALFLGLVAFMLGYKHNQITFFLQTLCLMGFSLADQDKTTIIFLNNLRYSYLQFTNQNPMRKYPMNYIKRANGNYNFLSIDDSYFRIFGWPFLFLLVILMMFLVYLAVNAVIIKYHRSKTDKRGLIKYFSQRKFFLRIIEYGYISLMYPLVFGAFQTFRNWNGLILVDFRSINYLNKTFCIAALLVNIGITVGIWFSTMSLMGRILHLTDLISSIVAAVIISNSVYSMAIVTVSLVLIIRNIVYLYLRSRYMSEQIKIIKLIWITIALETATIIIAALDQYIPMIVLVVVTVVTQVVFISFVIGFYTQEKYREKLTVMKLEKSDRSTTFQDEIDAFQEDTEKDKSIVSFVNFEPKSSLGKVAESNQIMMKIQSN